MILISTASAIEGYQIVAYKATAQGVTLQELDHHTKRLAANAAFNTCYDGALDVDTLFHGAPVVIEPIPISPPYLPREGSVVCAPPLSAEASGGPKRRHGLE